MSHASRMPEMKSFAGRLKDELQEVERLMTELLDASKILLFSFPSDGHHIVLLPTTAWGPSDQRQLRLQIALREKFSRWKERFQLLASTVPDRLRAETESALIFIESWIEKKSGYGIPATITEAKALFKTEAQGLHDVLATLDQAGKREIMLVPDTNAMLADADPKCYSTIVHSETYTVLLLPTVLGELDRLKTKHAGYELGDKATRAIKRVKCFREQGSLHSGVTVNRTVTVRAMSREPNFSETLSWLDPTNNDDRIIATTLEIQRSNPGAVVILVTSDINLQNKAEVAGVTCLEPPDS